MSESSTTSYQHVNHSNVNTTPEQTETKVKRKFQLPHVLLMMLIMMMFACLLTYVIPAGQFDTSKDGSMIQGTYHAISQNPVNPFYAITLILNGGIQSAQTITLLLFIGGAMGGILQLDSVTKLTNYMIFRFEHAGALPLIIGLFSLMAFIGFFVGGDQMIVFVTLGVILVNRLKLDPIMALAITFLPLYMAFSISPSGMAKIGQIVYPEVALYSGYGGRAIMYAVFLIITLLYVIWYARRVIKDPNKSMMPTQTWLFNHKEKSNDDMAIEDRQVNWRDIIVAVLVIVTPIILALGNGMLNWTEKYGNGVFITVFGISFVLAYLIKQKGTTAMVDGFLEGAKPMLVVAFAIIMANTISVILEKGKILSTIVNSLTTQLDGSSSGMVAVIVFIVAGIFNFLVPSGSGLMSVMIPILQPVTNALGVNDQMLLTSLSFGGGLGNLITPTLGATVGAIAIAKANFGSWFKFMVPLFLIWIVVGSVILYIFTAVGWSGGV
ncbi:YfcC family protein [Staphylococcus equorum]|uniref:Na+/H+ antiporter NhaC family protein n=1 Tax=Staphylococcus equorum TaxID=246432 RepID=UPI000D1C2465|nr:Na+/H+ antiporter NhaC family protein [Staphylococcus equorum]PTE41993.1 YfcC family protein [Staphylococcus equorum]PTE83617.1 YfcC family protein [Staphylococcus equorum]PTF11059.1 YfcC family protein [Staphylococcus equorum]RIL49207.1 YfcC family protein [Staphylococcus equorum]